MARPDDTVPPHLQALVSGHGRPILLLHAFAMTPIAYQAVIDSLTDHALVIAPWWMREPRRGWTFRGTVDALEALLDRLRLGRVTIVGHSYGGALALALAAQMSACVEHLVLVNALALSPGRKELARMAKPTKAFPNLVSRPGAVGFMETVLTRPRNVMAAGWSGYQLDLVDEARQVAEQRVPTSVLWGRSDQILPPSLGRRLADETGGTFHDIAEDHSGRPLDHDWPFRSPERFLSALHGLGVVGRRRGTTPTEETPA